MNPFRLFSHWRHRKKVVQNSQVQVYASRTTTFPLEACSADNLRTAARFDRRKSAKYLKAAHKQHKRASAEWYEIAADALESLADKLEHKGVDTVADLPYKERKEEVEMLMRISTGKG